MRADNFVRDLTLAGGRTVRYWSLPALEHEGFAPFAQLPYCIRVLIESLLRNLDRPGFGEAALRTMAAWTPAAAGSGEIPFMPARVLLQDFTGVPCVADLAALRGALKRLGGRAADIEPLIPVDLVIDHSVQLDAAAAASAYAANILREFERNRERYVFLRWGRGAFSKLRVLPPGLGICHQVNMEFLASCVRVERDAEGRESAFPDTLVGTDSHTVMVNSMGVLGWGVGGIEAEAAMLGQPIPMLAPKVVGVRLTGRLRAPANATDVALTLTEMLRRKGVVECLVEYCGPGVDTLSLEDRAPIANMAPEYGATTGFFPIDVATLRYLRATGRPEAHIMLVEAYARAQGLWRDPMAPEPRFNDLVELDLSTVEPTVAGPRRPHDRLRLADVGRRFDEALADPDPKRGFGLAQPAATGAADGPDHGAVVIASITSCTNTSNPALLVAAGLLARKAVRAGLRVPPWVKTSFAPGSRAAADFLRRAGLLPDLEALGFHIAAYGCATCIGNSGPLAADVEAAIRDRRLVAAAVLSGNRNFEGRIHPLTKANYLCSPPLVVAYALRGTVRGDLAAGPVGRSADGRDVPLAEIWPSEAEIAEVLRTALDPADYAAAYGRIDGMTPEWDALPEVREEVFAWDPASTYIREPPFFAGFPIQPPPVADIENAAVLGFFGDFITTDHISPAGSIAKDSPAARYLAEHGVAPRDFNSYGARRGNHEVMMRGTFANIRLRNRLADREGNWTVHAPTGAAMSFFDASEAYRAAGTPLVVIAGKMYGAGSSRDWAAKGPALLGVRAVIAESFERIHRSNLVEMGVLPLVFTGGQTADALGLTGREAVTIRGLASMAPRATVRIEARRADGSVVAFEALARVDNAQEIGFLCHGGILPFVLRGFLGTRG
jgi:aconitate hydratase